MRVIPSRHPHVRLGVNNFPSLTKKILLREASARCPNLFRISDSSQPFFFASSRLKSYNSRPIVLCRDNFNSFCLKMIKKNPNIPDSMLQVVAWILGEYGAGIPDLEKKTKILNLLVQVAYRPLEDELTRGYILSAVTKLHQALGFPENASVANLMQDYCKSKHVDVQ